MLRIVIADDDALFLENLVRHIPWQELGYTVAGAVGNGEEAIALCKRLQPDVALLDVKMPGLDGIASAEKILEQLSDCRVVFMSGYASGKDYRAAIRMKAVDFLEKPLTMEELCGILREMADASSSVEANSARTYSKPIETVISYIQKHYAQELSVASLAKMIYITPNYLSTIFKKETGETISSCILRTRMEAARKLLSTGMMSVKEIAALVGYQDVGRFSKAFHQHTGKTPKQYRKQH